ncbi:hypothetical protein Taro_012602 [Colocasia esculenta]|uniref:Uncharacterized protein n=1 Tax=Colocasia esculenta TaxID=4460 RepID=A0A843UE18_COLES|nr:hypothetical protein [Colocasia esculenta]
MGGCVSRPGEGCAGGRLKPLRRPRRQRRRVVRRRVSSRKAASMETIAEGEGSDDGAPAVDGDARRAYCSPAFQDVK